MAKSKPHTRKLAYLYWEGEWYIVILYLPREKYGCCSELELRKYDDGIVAKCQNCGWEYPATQWEIMDRTDNVIMETLAYVDPHFIQWLTDFYTSTGATK